MALPPTLRKMFEKDLAEEKRIIAEYNEGDVLAHRSGNGPFVSIIALLMEQRMGIVNMLEAILERDRG